MYNAGKTVFNFIRQHYTNLQKVGILCWKGNNAGDGFVIAHLLANAGIKVKAVCLAAENVYQGDALIYLKLCLNEKIDLVFPQKLKKWFNWPKVSNLNTMIW